MEKYKFVIIDFNATRRYSHHWSYVSKYKKFLEDFGEPYEIWIPKNAHVDISYGLSNNFQTFLQSNVYGFEKQENIIRWVSVKIIDSLLLRFKYALSSKKFEILKRFFSHFYTTAPYQRIKAISKSGVELNLVFPTMDSLAFRLVERCLKQGIPIKRICLRLGSGYKDIFKVDDIEERLNKLIREYPKCNLALGYETIPHKQFLLNHGLNLDNLFWTPAPPNKQYIESKNGSRVLTLGFLGVARPNKGFVEIPELVRSLTSHSISFQVIVQEAIYPWNEYINAIQQLKEFSDNVTILPANISGQKLADQFDIIDVLVLPYNTEDYKLAGSGLLFTAADLNIPTITKKGVAFEWDITNYSLGYTYVNSKDFITNIKYVMGDTINYGFDSYNTDRFLAIKVFLGITSDLS
jgi:hypothetical protein